LDAPDILQIGRGAGRKALLLVGIIPRPLNLSYSKFSSGSPPLIPTATERKLCLGMGVRERKRDGF
jgi:hypothetical protein